MFKKILLPVDGTEHSEKTIQCVKDIAKKCNSTVVIFHSYSSNPLYTMDMEEKLRQYSFAIVDKVVAELSNDDISVKSKIMKGHAGQLIIDLAKEENCDLIVMGKHDNNEIKNFLIGSVSNFVIHNSKIPIFLV
ncbi:MAG: universal stress protein [Candidatus Sericytochromatia bacterium]|nr:universal stress protein [Candidatus Sericytochromatia bacterium]